MVLLLLLLRRIQTRQALLFDLLHLETVDAHVVEDFSRDQRGPVVVGC